MIASDASWAFPFALVLVLAAAGFFAGLPSNFSRLLIKRQLLTALQTQQSKKTAPEQPACRRRSRSLQTFLSRTAFFLFAFSIAIFIIIIIIFIVLPSWASIFFCKLFFIRLLVLLVLLGVLLFVLSSSCFFFSACFVESPDSDSDTL